MIQVDKLNFKYNENIEVLKNISINIYSGEKVGLIGFNGSGKTTLINLLLGILKPNSGSIKVGDMVPNINNPSFKQHLGIAFDSANLVDYLAVIEYLQFVAATYRPDKVIDSDRINYYLHKFGLLNFSHYLIKDLSHGTQKKVQLISSFLSEPALLILDEPTNGLDFESTLILEELVQLSPASQAILIASHDFDFLEQACNKFYILNNGRLQFLSKEKRTLRDDVVHILKKPCKLGA